MRKSRKKTPQIDPRPLTRPRLNTLFNRHTDGGLDFDGLLAGEQALDLGGIGAPAKAPRMAAPSPNSSRNG